MSVCAEIIVCPRISYQLCLRKQGFEGDELLVSALTSFIMTSTGDWIQSARRPADARRRRRRSYDDLRTMADADVSEVPVPGRGSFVVMGAVYDGPHVSIASYDYGCVLLRCVAVSGREKGYDQRRTHMFLSG